MKLHMPAAHLPSGANKVFYGLLGGNIVVLALVGFLALRPVIALLQQHTAQITQLNGQIMAIQKKAADLRKLKEAYPQYEATYAPLLQNVPHTKDVAGYQAELEALATQTSNKLMTVDTSGKAAGGTSAAAGTAPASTAGTAPAAPTTQKAGDTSKPAASTSGSSASSATAGGFPAIPVRVELTGTYASVLDFVHRVETMDRITKITALNVESNGTTGAVRASLELTTLYLPGDKV